MIRPIYWRRRGICQYIICFLILNVLPIRQDIHGTASKRSITQLYVTVSFPAPLIFRCYLPLKNSITRFSHMEIFQINIRSLFVQNSYSLYKAGWIHSTITHRAYVQSYIFYSLLSCPKRLLYLE
jgi:hypothetical protein